jgi:hypothetical protein
MRAPKRRKASSETGLTPFAETNRNVEIEEAAGGDCVVDRRVVPARAMQCGDVRLVDRPGVEGDLGYEAEDGLNHKTPT